MTVINEYEPAISSKKISLKNSFLYLIDHPDRLNCEMTFSFSLSYAKNQLALRVNQLKGRAVVTSTSTSTMPSNDERTIGENEVAKHAPRFNTASNS